MIYFVLMNMKSNRLKINCLIIDKQRFRLIFLIVLFYHKKNETKRNKNMSTHKEKEKNLKKESQKRIWNGKVNSSTGSLFLLSLGLVIWPRLGDPFVSQNSREFSFFWTDSGLCIHHLLVWSNSKFLHNSRGSASPPIRIWFYILFLLTYCICFLCDWSFRLYHHIIYICYFVASCLLLL